MKGIPQMFMWRLLTVNSNQLASDVGWLPDVEGWHTVEIAVMGNDAGNSQTLGAGEVDRIIEKQPMRLS
jgi:hypothetical protein